MTDQRLLILKRRPTSNFTSLALNRLPDLNLTERASGDGTIRFGSSAVPWGFRGFGGWMPSVSATPEFFAVPDARRVFDIIETARRSSAVS